MLILQVKPQPYSVTWIKGWKWLPCTFVEGPTSIICSIVWQTNNKINGKTGNYYERIVSRLTTHLQWLPSHLHGSPVESSTVCPLMLHLKGSSQKKMEKQHNSITHHAPCVKERKKEKATSTQHDARKSMLHNDFPIVSMARPKGRIGEDNWLTLGLGVGEDGRESAIIQTHVWPTPADIKCKCLCGDHCTIPLIT